jgi:hypothetical protein
MNYPFPHDYQYAEAYRQAERRVRARVKFFWHLAIFLVVNSCLFGLYLENSLETNWFGYPWFLWSLGTWGFFLMLRFLRVFVFPDSPERRQQMITRELDRMNYPARLTYPVYPVQPPLATGPTYNHNKAKEDVLAGRG